MLPNNNMKPLTYLIVSPNLKTSPVSSWIILPFSPLCSVVTDWLSADHYRWHWWLSTSETTYAETQKAKVNSLTCEEYWYHIKFMVSAMGSQNLPPLVSVSQLRLVEGLGSDWRTSLKQHICILLHSLVFTMTWSRNFGSLLKFSQTELLVE